MRELDNAQPGHDDIASLLPWYLNRTLSTAETQLVEDHLHGCAQCQADSQLLHDTLDAAADHDVSFDASEARLGGLMQRIDAYEADSGTATGGVRSWVDSMVQSLGRLLAGPRRPLGLAVGLAVAILAGVLGTQLLAPTDDGIYETLSKEPALAASTIALRVDLDGQLDAAAVDALMIRSGVDHTWRRGEGNQVLIDVPDDLPPAELLLLIDALTSQAAVLGAETVVNE